MPNEPLIFVEVALVKGLAGSVQRLLDEKAPVLDPAQADTAIFYSISNCQRGLAGISFGNFLIKRVVEVLCGRIPQPEDLRDAVADPRLPPLAGCASWPSDDAGAADRGGDGRAAHRGARDVPAPDSGAAGAGRDPRPARLVPRPGHAARGGAGADPAVRALPARSRATRQPRRVDPVAHFHLSNGARVERINMRWPTPRRRARRRAPR